jgi:hypothetical protein
MVSSLSEHSEQIFQERVLDGRTFRALGERFDVSSQRVEQVFRAFARQHINQIELNLMVARKEGNLLALAIPSGFEPEQNAAINYLHWVLRELKRRDLTIQVHYRPLPEGEIAFLLEDRTNYDEWEPVR